MVESTSRKLPFDCDFDLTTVFNFSQETGRVGAWVFFIATDTLWWSDEVYDLFELEKGTHVSSDTFFSLVHEEDRRTVEKSFQNALSGQPYDITHRIVINNQTLWVNEKGSLYFDALKQTDLIIGMVHNITKEMKHILEIERQNRELTVIKNYFVESTKCNTMLDIIRVANENISKILHNISTSIVVTDQQNEQFNFFIANDKMVEYLDVVPSARPKYFGFEVIRAKTEKFITIDQHHDVDLKKMLCETGVKSLTSFPIIYNGEAFAALTIASASEGQLSTNDKSFCQTICGYLAYQLKNVSLNRLIQKGQSDLKILEEDVDTITGESLDFIAAFDNKGHFQRLNASFIKKLGFSQEYLKKRTIFDITLPHDKKPTEKALRDTVKYGHIRGFYNRLVCNDGSILELEWNAKYVPSHNYCIAIMRDITKQMEYEKTKNELEKSVEIEKLKTEFFATLSHELKTPINIILSSIQLIELQDKANKNSSSSLKFNKYIEQNAYRLLRLVNNLIDVSIIDNHFMSIHLRKADIVSAIETITQSCDSYALAKNISLRLTSYPLKFDMNFDQNMLDRILLNLLSNAIKHTSVGGNIQVKIEEESNDIRISVEDNGEGIPSQMLPIIFDRFRIVRTDFCRSCEGSGIGLSIVKNLVEMHGGSVYVRSTIDVGSCFEFTIPKDLKSSKNPNCDSDKTSMRYAEDLRQSRVHIEMSNSINE